MSQNRENPLVQLQFEGMNLELGHKSVCSWQKITLCKFDETSVLNSRMKMLEDLTILYETKVRNFEQNENSLCYHTIMLMQHKHAPYGKNCKHQVTTEHRENHHEV